MNAVAIAALGGVLALIMLDGGQAFRDKWEVDGGAKLESLSHLPLSGAVVPFQLIKDNPILPVLLDGDKHLTCWIVDTGYGFTAVDVRLAKRLKLKSTGRLSVQTLKTDELQSTNVPRGFIFDMNTNTAVVELPPHRAVIRDLPNTLESTFGTFSRCLKPGGILGITFLRNFVTRLDYRNNTLTFFDPNRFVYQGNGMRFDGWLEDEHYFLVPMTIDGVVANLALDTGAFATIMTKGFLDKYKREKRRNLGASSNAANNDGGGGSGGTVQASFSESVITLQKYQVGRAEIGNHRLNLEILCPKHGETPPGLLATDRFDGLMGYPVLKNFIIYLVYHPTPHVIFESA